MNKLCLLLAAALLLPACTKKAEDKSQAAAPPATLVTVTQAQTRQLEIFEQTIGSMESLIDPGVGAEVAAKVLKIFAHAGQEVKKGQLLAILDATDYTLQKREAEAEIARIEALLANQGRIVERNQHLVQKNFISQNALEDASTQQSALREQLEAARARVASIEHNGAKTQVFSPIDGRVEKQIVSPGDFVKQGDSLFQLIGTQKLRAHLPFPENVAAKLHPGQTVRLSTPTVPDQVYTTTIKEIKPLIGSNRAVDIIADVVDQHGWQGGASVNGKVILGEHTQAVVVPEASVVLRPAGEVVYVIKDKAAAQHVVKTGLRQEGLVEITEGLNAGEIVAVDGAAYLTDKAPVNVQQQSGQK
ncbi:MAG TPA: efflux RND transporter periplasmic adaptor subunit [Methylophilaceae bacterium]|nr:efflux RND transporter periplasmic adaptor subunit [Methylophilaceae bacterium]HQR60378.1 efflux RND transporter periplasmic adaptor subunit [Methylophilaceae bacterium]